MTFGRELCASLSYLFSIACSGCYLFWLLLICGLSGSVRCISNRCTLLLHFRLLPFVFNNLACNSPVLCYMRCPDYLSKSFKINNG